jgi:effector-binding domain-containing protein
MAIWKWVVGLGLAAGGAVIGYAQYERNVEQAKYTVLASADDFELREYAPLVVAEVTHFGDREKARGAGFERLAAYIFAKDRPGGGEAIAMTAPVLQDAAEPIAMTAPVMQDKAGADRWRTRFVMPAQYTLATLPPAPADITLTELPARRIAAVRFAGSGGAEQMREQEARLRAWMAEAGYAAAGEAEYAFYNSPFVPPPLRRNEVLIPVAAQ